MFQPPVRGDLLFHELIRAEQYWTLGIESFASYYVQGFLAGAGYDGIPLEWQRYVRKAEAAFSVEREVLARLAEGASGQHHDREGEDIGQVYRAPWSACRR